MSIGRQKECMNSHTIEGWHEFNVEGLLKIVLFLRIKTSKDNLIINPNDASLKDDLNFGVFGNEDKEQMFQLIRSGFQYFGSKEEIISTRQMNDDQRVNLRENAADHDITTQTVLFGKEET